MQDQLSVIAAWLDNATDLVAWLGIAALALSMAVCCVMLIRFPEVADRAIVFDLLMIHVVGVIALAAIVLDYILLLDTLTVVAVLGFLGTVAIARYLERSLRRPQRNGSMPTTPERDQARLEVP